MKTPKYSIITATYNSEKTIQKTLDSILNQTFEDFEYLIIDGGSKDDTLQILKNAKERFAKKEINFNWISEKDNGIYDAFNKGVAKSNGKWISFIGSDDYMTSDYLIQFDELIKNNNYEFVSAKADLMRNNEKVKEIGEAWDWDIFKKEMRIVHVGSMIKKNYFEKYGVFNESYRIAGDYELLLRSGNKLKAGFLNKSLIFMGDDGLSSTQVIQSLSEAKRAKIEAAKRNPFLANIELNWVLLKIRIKNLIGRP